uniref:ABC transporter domain-containing protein n=1 Tax=Caenorhabditis tropicalis TaxID=1561998 RepID=A0A1I7U161_9PELO
MNRVVIHFALVGCAFSIFGFFQFSLFKYVGDNTTYRVRKEFISRLLRKDAQYFDTVSTGYLSTVLTDYSKELKNGEKHGSRRAFFLATSRSVTHFFCNALNGVILYVGADLIYNKTMDQAVIVTLFHYMLFSAFSLGEASPHISYLSNAISSATPIFEILTSDDDIIENQKEPLLNATQSDKGDISFKNVSFSYPTRHDVKVLKGISFDINSGECVAIVGASGSGKSTIVQLLLHYYNIDSGNIHINGIEISNIELKKLRQMVGVVSQEPILFNATIEENIKYGNPKVSTSEIYDVLRKANAYDFVCAFPKGIKTMVGEKGCQLSGGQKQRIAIARVLVRNPKILLLDEATSALDNQSEQAVQLALRKASEGRTTIVIAHRLSTIRSCDKIMVISDGQIVEVGSHDELMAKKDVYENLVQAQFLDSRDHHGGEPLLEMTNQDRSVPTSMATSEEIEKMLKDTSEEEKMNSTIWEILRECRPDCFILFLAIFGSAIQGFSFPILAQLIVRTYKAYAMKGDAILINGHFWASMFLVLGVFRPITLYCQYFFFGKVAEKLSTRLRIRSFQHLLSLPCAFYDEPNNSPTRLANRLNAEASNIKAAVDARLGSVLMTVVSLIVATSIACYYSWKLTIQVLLFFPLLYFAKFCYEKTTVLSIKQDSLAFEKSNKIVYALSFKFGTYLILQKEVLPMDMYLALVTLSYTSNMAGSAISYLPDYKKALHAAGLILNLFTYPATMPYDSLDGKRNIDEGRVETKEIKFHYHQRPDHIVLKNVNLKLEAGKTLALVGPSGAGKSTVISLLEMFYRVDSGSLNIDKENIENINLHHLRANLALVSQEPSLFNCSIRNNLLYGLNRSVKLSEIERALKTANALQFVYQFPENLETIVGERGAQLSGGQKQRIAIARAILRNPKVLLLDEATSALDSDSEKVVQNALDTASERLSTVIVAHRLSTVINADSIAVLKLGKVVEQGTHVELVERRGVYWKLIQNQGK